MEQFVIVLIIGAISLGKWLMEKSAEARAKAEADARADSAPERSMRPRQLATAWDAPRPIANPLPGADAAARRLRKALGLPEEAELPPPIEHRRESAPSKPVIVYERPLPLTQVVADLEQRVFTASTPPSSKPKPKPAYEITQKSEPARTPLDELLRSREGLRKAILVQEILGTPKGLVF